MDQKGFVNILIGAVIVVGLASMVGYFFVINQQGGLPQKEKSVEYAEAVLPPPTPVEKVEVVSSLQEESEEQPQQEKDPSREEVFASLIKNSWCDKNRGNSMLLDYTDYKFNPDGTYKWYRATDYTPLPSGGGKWNFEQTSEGHWFLLYDDGQRLRFTLKKDGSLLTLENKNLDSCDPIVATKKYDASTLPPIQVSSSVKEIIDKLTVNKWKRANDFNLDHKPILVEFEKNFKYVTTYHDGECQNSGSWYATVDEIEGRSLVDECDPRDNTYPESFSAKMLDNDFVLLEHDLYVPENYQLEKGVIWSVLGHSGVVNIKVEYDMPIKVGVPNRFDIEMTNVGEKRYPGPITLQRFSVTEGYIMNYRQANNVIAQVNEIAGQDLELKVLQPDDIYRFSLDVTFEKSGKQPIYINGLMYGRTQDWDTQQHYSVNVQ